MYLVPETEQRKAKWYANGKLVDYGRPYVFTLAEVYLEDKTTEPHKSILVIDAPAQDGVYTVGNYTEGKFTLPKSTSPLFLETRVGFMLGFHNKFVVEISCDNQLIDSYPIIPSGKLTDISTDKSCKGGSMLTIRVTFNDDTNTSADGDNRTALFFVDPKIIERKP